MIFLFLFLCFAQEITYKNLSNGIEVLLGAHPSSNMLEIMIEYHVAPVAPHEAGLAHLVEHLMFHPAKNMEGRTFDQWLEDVGGSSRAQTTLDRLQLSTTVPVEAMERVFFLESERMFQLCTHGRLPSIEEEKDVVIQEFLNDQLSFDKRIAEILRARVFGRSTMGLSVLGDIVDLQFYTQEEICSYIETKLINVPIRIIVIGDLETEKTMESLERWFQRERTPFPKQEAVDKPLSTQHLLWYPDNRSALYVLWPIPAIEDPRSAQIALLKSILVSRKFGWLQHPKYSVHIWEEQSQEGGYWLLRMEGASPKELHQYLEQRLADLHRFWRGLRQEQLNIARAYQKRAWLHNTVSSSAQTHLFSFCLRSGYPPSCLEDIFAQQEQTSKKDILLLVQTLFSMSNAYVLSVHPEKSKAVPRSIALREK